MSSIPQVDIGRFELAAINQDEAIEHVDKLIKAGEPNFICFCEANLFYHARRNDEVASALRQANAVFADGTSLLKLAGIYGHRLPGRVTGPGFFLRACEEGVTRNWKHFFMGGAEGVADTLAQKMTEQFDGIQIAGTCCPPFRELSAEENQAIISTINDSGADLLWVAFGGPKQELWMAENLNLLKVPVSLGVGAAFDFHSGNRAWAPGWIRFIGMEWAFRMLTGGFSTARRNIRCVSDSLFFLMKEWIRVKVFRRAPIKKSNR